MTPFSYRRAQTVEQAAGDFATTPGAAYLAGGTTLVDLLKLNVAAPAAMIDINDLPLSQIEPTPSGGLRLGAMVRNSTLAAHATVKHNYPVLAEALLSGASPQLRNMATVGGNLMQRTRCFYFRDPLSRCNKRNPGTGCDAIEGYNRIHAILGTSDRCIAAFPGDMPVALTALDAIIHLRAHDGSERSIPIADFYVSYGDDPVRETTLAPGELILAVELPPARWFARSAYLKVRDRASYDFALASAAVALETGGGIIQSARVALGGIATRPWRSADAERKLVGAPATEETFRAAAAEALKEAQPQRHNAFKIELARRTILRALQLAASRTA